MKREKTITYEYTLQEIQQIIQSYAVKHCRDSEEIINVDSVKISHPTLPATFKIKVTINDASE